MPVWESHNTPNCQGYKQTRDLYGATLTSHIGQRFTVTAGVTSYAGRLVIVFPERLMGGTRFERHVDDVQDQTIASLKETYGDAFTNVVKSLIR